MSENVEMTPGGEVHDEYTETREEYTDSNHSGGEKSCCSSMICAIVGFLVIIGCSYGHYRNEKGAVERSELYDHVEKTAFLMVSGSKKSEYKGKLVHWNTDVNIDGADLKDEIVQRPNDTWTITAKCVKLKRVVQMWQVCETKNEKTVKEGGKKITRTTYSYDSKWSSTVCDSSKFHEQNKKYKNKPFNVKNKQFTSKVSVYADNSTKLMLSDKFRDSISWQNSERTDLQTPRFISNNLTKNAFENSPEKGDYKIYWNCYGKDKDEVSMLGKINDDASEMVAYTTELRILWTKFETEPLAKLTQGSLTLSKMVENLRTESKIMLWIIRIVLFVAIIAGAIAFVGPLSYLIDKIPCCGDFLSGIIDFVAGVAGFLWSVFVCVLCWCLVRPWLLLGFGIVLVICIGAVIAYKKMKPKKAEI